MRPLEDPEILRAILESMHTAVYFVGRDQRIQFWNHGAERITGYLRQDVVGHFCKDFFPAQKDEDATGVCEIGGALSEVLRDGRPTCSDVAIRHREGHQVLLRVRAVPIRGADGAIVGAAESFEEDDRGRDTERRRSKLQEYGCLDGTTGLLSATYTQTHLGECLGTFAKHHLPFSIACVRVDNLAQLRTQYGPAALREVIRIVAQTLENSLRPTDFLGRSEGGGFLAILPECNSLDAARLEIRLQGWLRNMSVKWWGDEFPVSATIVLATAESSDTVESLIARGERRLHAGASNTESKGTQ